MQKKSNTQSVAELRSHKKVVQFRDNLITLHDELADLKSYFDGQKNISKDDDKGLIYEFRPHMCLYLGFDSNKDPYICRNRIVAPQQFLPGRLLSSTA